MNTPRSCFLRSIRAVLEGMLERVWNLEKGMVGCGLGAPLLEDSKNTWQRGCIESLKREQEVLVLADELKAQGHVEKNTRAMTIRGRKRIRKIRQEEESALTYLQDRKNQQEDEMWKRTRRM